MKHFVLVTLLGIAFASVSLAEDKLYPLDFKMRVYPEEICYGDPCFITFSLTNNGQETLYLPFGEAFWHFSRARHMYYYIGEERVLLYDRAFDNLEGVFAGHAWDTFLAGRPVKPGETWEFHTRLVWFPLPEFAYSEQSKALLKQVNQENNFKILVHLFYRGAYNRTPHIRLYEQRIFPDAGLDVEEMNAKGYYFADYEELESTIRILPRSEEEIRLLQEWYLELPTTTAYEWTYKHVFAHSFYVKGAPFKMEALTPFELWQKRSPFNRAQQEFFESMETRTPESLARIERTNELAAKILERAKLPDSTISQNMVEFVQLRSFLVDMRYAESLEAEQAAFEKLMNFVEQAKDKELWIKFLDAIGFHSIRHEVHFPNTKMEQYRKLFGERFPQAKVLPQNVQ